MAVIAAAALAGGGVLIIGRPRHTQAAPAREQHSLDAAGRRHAASRVLLQRATARAGPSVAPPSAPPPGSGGPIQPGWVLSVHHLESGGLVRYYLLARPPADPGSVAPSPLPVLVVLHGRMMTPARMMAATQFLGEVGRAIVVFPAGYEESWNAGYCCGGAHAAGVDDVAFLDAVVRQVVAQQPGASPTHVFLAGFSNGGRMAYRLACDAPGMFAGVAAVEAVSVSTCAHTKPVPLLLVAQTGDPLLTISSPALAKHIDGHTETTVDAEAAFWRGLDGCRGPDVAAAAGDLSTWTWDACRDGSRVEEAVYGGGAHDWFRGCRDTPSAQALVWSFFHDTAFHDTVPAASASGPACPGAGRSE